MRLLFSVLLLMAITGQVVTRHQRKPTTTRKPNPPKSTCIGKYECNGSSEAPYNPTSLWYTSCYCDELCKSYGDCCRNVTTVPSSNSSLEIRRLTPEVISCQDLGDSFETNLWWPLRKIYVVNKCPNAYKEDYIIKMCQNTSEFDTLTHVPVNGRKSRILYRNYYCAMCNKESDVVFWEGKVPKSKILSNRPISLDDVVLSPPEGYTPRICKDVIRQCAEDWEDTEVAKRCTTKSGSNAFVYSVSQYSVSETDAFFGAYFKAPSTGHMSHLTTAQKIYRNKHCARCNRVNKTRCTPNYLEFTMPAFSAGAYIPMMPYSVLMEVKEGEPTATDSFGSSSAMIYNRCQGQLYDNVAKKCRRPIINCGNNKFDEALGVCVTRPSRLKSRGTTPRHE